MRYIDLEGSPRHGFVWSAGPVANSAWVRSESTWAVVDLKSRRQVEYSMPIYMREQPPERVKWAEDVLKSRRLLDPPIPDHHIVCDPEADMARVIWNLAIAQDKTKAAIHATRYADRASVSAKRLLELEKDQ